MKKIKGSPIDVIWNCYSPYIKGKQKDIDRILKENRIPAELIRNKSVSSDDVSFRIVGDRSNDSSCVDAELVMSIITNYPELMVTCLITGDPKPDLSIAVVISECGQSKITKGIIVGNDAADGCPSVLDSFEDLFEDYYREDTWEEPHSGEEIEISIDYIFPFNEEWTSGNLMPFGKPTKKGKPDKQKQLKSTKNNKDFVVVNKTLKKYKGDGGEVIIPAEIEVIAAEAFKGKKKITSVRASNGLKEIGEGAFENCKKLKSIEIPESVTSIRREAFRGCDGLASIKIPSSVTEISNSTFYCCGNLKEVVLPDKLTRIGINAFGFCSTLTDLKIPNSVLEIDTAAFQHCEKLESVVLPIKLLRISDDLFRGCSGLQSVSIPEGVTGIGNYSFSGCKKLVSIDIPSKVKEIGYSAFYGCTDLGAITIPDNVKEIGAEAFSGCTNLNNVNGLNESIVIGDGAFYGCENLADNNGLVTINSILYFYTGTEKSEIVIPSDIKEISRSAFSHHTEIKSVSVSKSVLKMGNWAFLGCSNLERISVPNSVKEFGFRVFDECGKLIDSNGFIVINGILFSYIGSQSELSIPDGVRIIKEYAISDGFFSHIKEIIISGSVREIKEQAFSGCFDLKKVKIPESVKMIGNGAFSDNNNQLTIECQQGSYAEQFAKEHGIAVVNIEA